MTCRVAAVADSFPATHRHVVTCSLVLCAYVHKRTDHQLMSQSISFRSPLDCPRRHRPTNKEMHMSTLRAAALLCVLALAPSLPAFAGIYSSHDPSIIPTAGHFQTGAGNLTVDSEGLTWLDLTLTTDMSYDDIEVERQYGGSLWGYRVATAAEVLTLWTHAGIANNNYNSTDDSVDLWNLQSMWGVTTTTQDPRGPLTFETRLLTSTWMYAGKPWEGYNMSVMENVTSSGARDYVAGEAGSARGWVHGPNFAPALVQDASVPEPSSLVLATLGLLGGFAVVRVRRRRRTSASHSCLETQTHRFNGPKQRCEDALKQGETRIPLPVQPKRMQAEAAALLGVTLPTAEESGGESGK